MRSSAKVNPCRCCFSLGIESNLNGMTCDDEGQTNSSIDAMVLLSFCRCETAVDTGFVKNICNFLRLWPGLSTFLNAT